MSTRMDPGPPGPTWWRPCPACRLWAMAAPPADLLHGEHDLLDEDHAERVSGASGQQGMMKMMTYGMRSCSSSSSTTPSGLILYWSVMNIISIVPAHTNKKKANPQPDRVVQQVTKSGASDDESKINCGATERSTIMTREFEGKTEQEAIAKAIEELHIEREDFDVEIIELRQGPLQEGQWEDQDPLR